MSTQATTTEQDFSDKDFLDDLISRKEAARVLGVTPESLSVMHCRKDGKTIPLSRYKRGRRTLYSRSEIAALIRSNRIPPNP